MVTRYLVSLRGSNQLCRTPWDANHEKVGTSARYQHRTSVAARRAIELSAHHYGGHHYREMQFAVMPFSVSRERARERIRSRKFYSANVKSATSSHLSTPIMPAPITIRDMCDMYNPIILIAAPSPSFRSLWHESVSTPSYSPSPSRFPCRPTIPR